MNQTGTPENVYVSAIKWPNFKDNLDNYIKSKRRFPLISFSTVHGAVFEWALNMYSDFKQ